ncbi:hypothetical protein [Novosphingobium capsulatum]|uniref:hypothetical protein n=1 Tax=Novosphingobium capsulatum TaxID=13688 RepID=UPI002E159894|nr:hypothetical protein U0041_17450 [Novosphingobium capsulatum]
MRQAESGASFDWRAFARRVVIDEIEVEPDLSVRKARILHAHQHGHLTADDAEDWIVLGGMAAQ